MKEKERLLRDGLENIVKKIKPRGKNCSIVKGITIGVNQDYIGGMDIVKTWDVPEVLSYVATLAYNPPVSWGTTCDWCGARFKAGHEPKHTEECRSQQAIYLLKKLGIPGGKLVVKRRNYHGYCSGNWIS